jgi:hypothetical protein
MIMQAQVQALQEEVNLLLAKLDESEARVDALEALLREAEAWVPAVTVTDLRWRIAAALKETP